MKNKVLVSPIAFNEKEKIHNVIQRFINSRMYSQVDYLIMDDCSTDGTTDIIRGYQNQGVKTLRHQKRSGVGAAIRTVIKFAIKEDYEVLVIMAGNDKDNPEEISNLVDPILRDGYDLVQGSRYLNPSGRFGAMPFYRKVATRLHPLLMGLFTGKKVTDTTNGFRAFKLRIFQDERINLDQDWLDAYELEPYILFKVLKLKFRHTEAPVTKIYPPKKLGYTKMQPFIGWWSILRPVFYLGLGLKK